MQFTTLALLSLSAFSMAVPVAEPEAEAVASPNPDAALELFRRGGGSSSWCCPKGKRSSCDPCAPHAKCPSDKPDQYSECSNLGQVGLINLGLVLCNILNNNNVDIPITVSL